MKKETFEQIRNEGIKIVKNIRKTMLPDYDLHDALWVHWHDHFEKKITEEENRLKDLIKVLEKTTSHDGDKVIIDLSHLREYIKKHFPELDKKEEMEVICKDCGKKRMAKLDNNGRITQDSLNESCRYCNSPNIIILAKLGR